MSNKWKFCLLIIFVSIFFIRCEKESKDQVIVHGNINKEYVLIRNVGDLQKSDDEISNHIDSILSGKINTDIISTGQKEINLNDELTTDIGFEIVDLNLYNPNGLPEWFDSLAAVVIPLNVEILDNSTYGYPDALNLNEPVDEDNNWTKRTCVLGTFENGGNFQGSGEKFLGFRFTKDDNYKYGWLRIYCSQHNDTLRIIDFAYNDVVNSLINAGQKE